ncbi:Hypothetical predicted protein [Podarcis lilfordi]|uniref:Uncharacterized protein n=1 Tax=Podarcis lilfordi TaxID=74358 RepID=A0AA35LME7_9SAUR|nr:Hypothetical predicted protein [Podarcis lilfordi]
MSAATIILGTKEVCKADLDCKKTTAACPLGSDRAHCNQECICPCAESRGLHVGVSLGPNWGSWGLAPELPASKAAALLLSYIIVSLKATQGCSPHYCEQSSDFDRNP